MKTARFILILALLAPAAFGQGAGPTCSTDSDCAATPATPHCANSGTCVACVDYAGNPCIPVACDGGLCDTTTGSGCATAGSSSALLLAALAFAFVRRGRRR